MTVLDAPEVYILKKRNLTFFNVKKDYDFQCKANGFPYPTVEWSFKYCQNESLDLNECNDFVPVRVRY